MSSRPVASEARPAVVAANRAAVRLATAFGLGNVRRAPGTAGSLVAVLAFVPFQLGLANVFVQLGYLVALMAVAIVGLWSVEASLSHWSTRDPQPIVIDEILGQWLTLGALVLLNAIYPSAPQEGAGWIYLLLGFILFRAFDVLKPFPIRQSERLPGASGILLDDTLAGLYAGIALLALVKTGWLS